MPAYTIVQGTVTDPKKFVEYILAVPPVVEQYGGHYIVKGSDSVILEGASDTRKVVVHQWANSGAARKFWYSPEYKMVRRLREAAGDFQVTLVESP
ncbi:MAG: hypothetical protein ACI9AP_000027 [Flavobacteriales bacterium]|jgi:uncharacterized protein (DUF1330 family)